MSLNEELLKSAEDALSRGFAILTCLPHDKAPWASYSPNACHSASRVPEIALKAWHDGTEANYGVGCETSGITVLDADHGLANYEEFVAWRTENNLPPTYTVRTGRRKNKTTGEPEYGIQMYYSKAIPTTAFSIGNVTGELKGKGGYVYGAGSVHPDSGEKYEILEDIDIAPLPEGLLIFEKKKLEYTPKSAGGELIPAGSRWIHCQSMAGKLRNMGMDRDGIYAGLKNFLKNNCEDGENYPDDKIQNLADAAVTKFDAAELTPVITFGGSNKKIDNSIANLPDELLEGDWIGEMTHALADGTHIPPSFVRATIKAVLGASLDGMVGFPHHPDLHMRNYSFLIAPGDSGKGESWKRVSKYGMANYIEKAGIFMGDPGWYSSGEFLVKKFVENGLEDRRVVTHFDEMRLLFEKGAGQNSTLNTRMLNLYDGAEISAGSCTNAGGTVKNVSVTITGGFTKESFTRALSGKALGDDGFLSRCVLSYVEKPAKVGDWDDMNPEIVNPIQQKMLDRWTSLSTMFGTPGAGPHIPTETDAAKELRLEFDKWLHAEMDADSEFGHHFCGRLDSHFKRDLLLRTLFSEDPNVITEAQVKKAADWAAHELMLRREIWPADQVSPVSQMCTLISKAFKKKENITKMRVIDFCNVNRDGTHDEFGRAWKAMLTNGTVYLVGKTHKKTDIFAMKGEND